MRRSSISSAPRRTRARRTIIGVVLLAGVVGAGAAVRHHTRDEAAPATTVAVLTTALVDAGDLTTTESLDGTLSETGAIEVVHRIEGQTSSNTGSSGASTSASGPASASSGASASTQSAGPAIESVGVAVATAPTGSCDTSTTVATTVAPDAATTDPSASTTSTTTSTTSTTSTTIAMDPDVSASSSTEPATSTTICPAPTSDTPTSDTTPVDTTSVDTTPAGAPSGGAAPSVGQASSAAPASSSSGSSSSARITQLVTWVAPAGTAIASGDQLYTIEGSPVIAMYGALPAWRTLSTDSDDGADVVQLESNLRALGFDPDAAMTIDAEFDGDTEAAVERWQAALGVEVTGEVALGSVVFVPAATTVTSTSARIGDTVGDGDEIVTLAGSAQQVVVEVPADDQADVVPGTEVTVGGTAATVVALRSAESDGAVSVRAVIAPSEPIDAVDGSAVKVRLAIEHATGVLLVPADALLSRLDGTYAVQTSAADGDHRFVTVEVLGVADGRAGVRGDGLAAGDTVWVPV